MKAGFLNGGKPAGPKPDVFGDLLGGAFGASKPSGPMSAAAKTPTKSSPTPATQSQPSWSNPSAGADDFLKGLGKPASGGKPASAPAPSSAAAAPSTDDLLAAFGGSSSTQSKSTANVSNTSSYSTPGEAPADVDNLPPPPANVDGSTALTKGNQAQSEGSYADAIKWYTWALQLTSSSDTSAMVTILLKRAESNKENGEHKKAIADTTQAIQLKPDDDKLLLKRAFLYEGLEKYKLALADFKKIIELGHATVAVERSVTRMETAIQQLG